jgi:hypothetical protein
MGGETASISYPRSGGPASVTVSCGARGLPSSNGSSAVRKPRPGLVNDTARPASANP